MGEQLLLVTGRLFVAWRSSPLHFASADTVIHIVSSGQSTSESIELLIEDQAITQPYDLEPPPTPFQPPLVSKLERRHTGRQRQRAKLLMGEGEGVGEEPNHMIV
jgi:hypothetical protein